MKNSIIKLKNLFQAKKYRKEHTPGHYFAVLDGWRGISILLVLATHLLPLGPKFLRLNETSGPMGMSLFFVLSGFLITNFLLHKSSVRDFMIRRLFRIVPLAWLYLIIVLPLFAVDPHTYLANFLFVANWPPMALSVVNSHFWSLCVEVQFYVGIAVIFYLLGEKGLYLIPVICLAVTGYRVYDHVLIAINTYYRVDEILVGGILALAYNHKLGGLLPRLFAWVNPYVMMVLLLISCHPDSGFMNYFRPYFAVTLVASTLYSKQTLLADLLTTRILAYLAATSYALYVIHPALAHSWLGSGDTLTKYAKRPLLFALLFILAHLSTFYYEKHWIALGKKLTTKSAMPKVVD